MSMNKVSMALDDVIKADRKANKGKGNKNGKKGGGGINKKNGNAKNNAARQPATAQLVKKLVKRALAQRGVGVKPRNIRRNNTAAGGGGNRTIVKKVVRRVSGPQRGNRNKSLGVSQRSRTIVRRRVIPAPQPTRTIVREVRYIREPPRPAPQVQRRVVYQQPRPAPRQVVYVDRSPPRRQQQRFGGSSFSNRRPAIRRNADPFYEPRNFLQRVSSGRY